jgi:hypothetical protein
MSLPYVSISQRHKYARPSEDMFAVLFSQEWKTKQETADAKEYSQKCCWIVDGSPEYMQIGLQETVSLLQCITSVEIST